MSDPYIGEIRILPFTYAPAGWLDCEGQQLSVREFQALAAVLGTTYGGDGMQTFNLPDLRGYAPVGAGQGNGLSLYPLGKTAGETSVQLSIAECPVHNHSIQGAVAAKGFTGSPAGSYLTRAAAGSSATSYTFFPSFSDQQPKSTLASSALGVSGSPIPEAHDNQQPCLGFRFCIAYEGIFPVPE